jgi:hypothetical protein
MVKRFITLSYGGSESARRRGPGRRARRRRQGIGAGDSDYAGCGAAQGAMGIDGTPGPVRPRAAKAWVQRRIPPSAAL